jgi:hypothetical protein
MWLDGEAIMTTAGELTEAELQCRKRRRRLVQP